MRELDLDRELRALGSELAVPPAPDLVPAVRARLAAAPARASLLRRPLVVALAALAVAVAAAMAVPQARTAILEFLRIQGATVERVPEPPIVTRTELGLGEPISLAEARTQLEFDPLVPDFPGLGSADAVYVDQYAFGGQILFLYGTEAAPRLLVSEFRADLNPQLISKAAGPGTSIEPITVGEGLPGFWVAGEPHELIYRGPDGEIRPDRIRLAGNALVWERGRLTFRIEAAVTKQRALELAETLGR
jgi:hypothetical protein